MIDAWLRASLMTASSSLSRVSNRPPLASKHEPYRTASSNPKKRARAASSRGWTSWVPQMKRTLDIPKPRVVEGLLGRRHDLRVRGEPQVVVGAEVQHATSTAPARPTPRRSPTRPAARRGDPLLLPQALGTDLVELRREQSRARGSMGLLQLAALQSRHQRMITLGWRVISDSNRPGSKSLWARCTPVPPSRMTS